MLRSRCAVRLARALQSFPNSDANQRFDVSTHPLKRPGSSSDISANARFTNGLSDELSAVGGCLGVLLDAQSYSRAHQNAGTESAPSESVDYLKSGELDSRDSRGDRGLTEVRSY